MAECVECGDDFRLEDGYEDDGMCHQCAHAIAEGQNSRMVSERDLTIRDLRAREEQGARIRQQIEDTLRAADTRATQAEARAERYREALENLVAEVAEKCSAPRDASGPPERMAEGDEPICGKPARYGILTAWTCAKHRRNRDRIEIGGRALRAAFEALAAKPGDET